MEFKEYLIEHICVSTSSGGTPKSTNPSYYNNGTIPWLNTKEINFNNIYKTDKMITEKGLKNSSAKFIEKNNVIVAMYGATAGRCAINKIKLTTNQACCNLKINSEIADYNFVYYYLTNNYRELASLANGGAQQNLNSQTIKNFPIKIPSLKNQKKIIKVLRKLDDKIELNNKINNNLTKISSTIYKRLFVDKKHLNSKTGINFKNYGSAALGDVCKISYGKLLPTTELLEEGYPVYGGNGIIGKYYKYFYEVPKTIISCRGAASGTVITAREKSYITNNSLILDAEELLYFYIKEMSLDKTYYQYRTGSAQPQITIDNIKDIQITLASNELLLFFNNIINNLEKKQFLLEDESITLSNLKDVLLPQLMTGKINLDNIEI